jgi:orotate phosphoribosyltransferase
VGAVITDTHVVLTSGKHSDTYVNKDALYPHTKETSQVSKMMAEKFVGKNVEVVVGPATAGVVLSQWVAHHLSRIEKREVFSIYTDKTIEGGVKRQEFKRGYDKYVRGKRVLIVEDITATGGSVKKVVKSVKEVKGKIVGICVMVNRVPNTINRQMFGVPFVALGVFESEAIPASRCPMCKTNIPINTEIGHGKEFVKKNGL